MDCPGSNHSTILTPKDRVLLVSSSGNKNYTITELFLWPSEMTPDQVLAEYQGMLFDDIFPFLTLFCVLLN